MSKTKKSKTVKKVTRATYDRPIDAGKMRRGDVAKIAYDTFYSQSHVSNVLAGRRQNKEIVKSAKALTQKRKSKSVCNW